VSDVGYVAAGWVLTGAVLLGYWLRVQQRIRRAERTERES
jgi:HAMP domain-containing protein